MIIFQREGGLKMPDNKIKNDTGKNKPSIANDQLGENAGIQREAKTTTKGGKCR